MSGMTARDVVRRIEAFKDGRPLPRGTTIHFPIKRREALLLSFVRMGGETFPWGLAYSRPGGRRTILTVPEPRDRTLVADMILEFAPVLLSHVNHPDYTDDEHDLDNQPPLSQVWLPNPTHLTMLHYLNFAYGRTNFGNRKRKRLLRAFGRACGWLFRESQRPGQVTVIDASGALRESFTFPADDLRQQHLGFLLAWLETKGGRKTRIQAAAEAEALSIATALNPDLERTVLSKIVEGWNETRHASNEARMKRSAREIKRALVPELQRRLDLTERARRILAEDKRRQNSGVEKLEDASLGEHWYQYLRLEKNTEDDEDKNDGPIYTPHPETDYAPSRAASRYYIMEASEELYRISLIHDDLDLQEEAIASGDAFRGQIVRVRDEGNGRRLTPIWSIHVRAQGPLRLKGGSGLVLLGDPGVQAYIRTIRDRGRKGRDIEVEIKVGKKKSEISGRRVENAASTRLKGLKVAFAVPDSGFFLRRKSSLVWKRNGPGKWLTHDRMPPEPAERTD
ncbi:MAG: hypothetical protein ABIJ56_02225 [Pseudomonadota bacterium]